jgi:nitrogen-specific signal transduction histidine kinase/CheY-like chemotaxis protein
VQIVSHLADVAWTIIERKRAEQALQRSEEQLRGAQRMEAIGRLAGGIAHDFNNLLTVIINHAAFATDSVSGGDPVQTDLTEIRKAADRAAALTRQLLAFSRKQLLQPKVLDLSKIVGGMEGMLRRLLGEDIALSVILAMDLGKVMADPGQVEQVVMNLAVNARDAMPDGGKLTIETANIEIDEASARQHAGAKSGPHVVLSVTDTGCGMDEKTRARLFEPFFTTKATGKGTGLGLATVYGIVKQSGGTIWVNSEPGKGTTFKVYLPRELRASETAARVPQILSRSAGAETILVVEDEAGIRNVARRMLSDAGYTVLTAASGDEALLVCERHQGTVRLVLTDVVMPGMYGKELADRLASLYPHMQVLYMSGYTDDSIGQRGVLDPGTHFIGKPFNAAELTHMVHQVLDQEAPPNQSSKHGWPPSAQPRIVVTKPAD